MTTSKGSYIEYTYNRKIPYLVFYIYGYRNMYELSELVNTNSDIIEFEGTAVSQKPH